MDDLISRQTAIDALKMDISIIPFAKAREYVREAIETIYNRLEDLPSAQPDLSSYSDKLWRSAYERGKAEAQAEIIRCRDCRKYRRLGCPMGITVFDAPDPDGYCYLAERRTDEQTV